MPPWENQQSLSAALGRKYRMAQVTLHSPSKANFSVSPLVTSVCSLVPVHLHTGFSLGRSLLPHLAAPPSPAGSGVGPICVLTCTWASPLTGC
jgi:hypothetical protein